MKTQFEDAARNVEQTVSSEINQTTADLASRLAAAADPLPPPGSGQHDGADAAAAVPASEEELAPEARRDAAVVQAAGTASAARRSRARRAWRASVRRALGVRPMSADKGPDDELAGTEQPFVSHLDRAARPADPALRSRSASASACCSSARPGRALRPARRAAGRAPARGRHADRDQRDLAVPRAAQDHADGGVPGGAAGRALPGLGVRRARASTCTRRSWCCRW